MADAPGGLAGADDDCVTVSVTMSVPRDCYGECDGLGQLAGS